MQVGITGLPGSGRSTVFRGLLAHRAPKEAGARGSAAIGAIQVQEPRLDVLAEHFRPEKVTPIEIHLHDACTSLEPGFPKSEIEAMKRFDQLLLVVPAFADPSPEASARALDSLLEELCLEDLGAIERRLKTAQRDKLDDRVKRALERAQQALESGRAISCALEPDEREPLTGSGLLTDRPMIAILNVAEDRAGEPAPPEVQKRAEERGLSLLVLCAALESEMAELPADERREFLAEYGVEEPGGAAVTRAILDQADIIPFFTVGEDECRAWAIARGTSARAAAGKIHSDLERGFIRAEVIAFDELAPLKGGLAEAKKLGKLRLEGKDYVVQDGEIVHVRFNV